MKFNPLSITIKDTEFSNPFLPASGCFGYGEEASLFYNIEEWGCLLTKTITLEPREGNPPPRIIETPSGLLNSIGLANPGIDEFMKNISPLYKDQEIPLMVSIAGNTFSDYQTLAKKLEKIPEVKAIEVNISCPNIKSGGIAFGTDAGMVKELISMIRECFSRILVTKMTPNVNQIVEPSLAAQEAGSDALTLSNTYLGMAIDIKNRKPYFKNTQAGLSGPAIKPMALLKVFQVYREVEIPIIAAGGISTLEDCLEFILAGASALQLGTSLFRTPDLVIKLKKNLNDYLKSENLRVCDLVGKAH